MHQQAVIGLIGGMSWESSAEYYRIINREVRRRLGGVHSARTLMWSVDFGEIERLQHDGDWDTLTENMKEAAIRLERGGADFVLICTNTMHRMADAVAEAINIPLLHIADPTAQKVKAAGFKKVGLLGTAGLLQGPVEEGLRSRCDSATGCRPTRRSRHHLQRIGCWRSTSRIASGIPQDHCRPGRARCAGHYSWVHGDHASRLGRRQCSAAVRYHHDPCRRRC